MASARRRARSSNPRSRSPRSGWSRPRRPPSTSPRPGYVVPQGVAKVGAKVSGRVTKVSVREGQDVKAGDLLFELDPSDQKSAIASAQARVGPRSARAQAARAQLAESKVQFEREKRLAAYGIRGAVDGDDSAPRRFARGAGQGRGCRRRRRQAEVAALAVTLGNLPSPRRSTAPPSPSRARWATWWRRYRRSSSSSTSHRCSSRSTSPRGAWAS